VRLETVCTGDELLTGLTSDTNSRFFQERTLRRLGVKVARSTVVGDTLEDIAQALTEAGARSDAVLVSGGLGPTLDDLTAAAAAKAAGVELVEDPGARAHVIERFKARGVAMPENNLRQALVPRGARVVLNTQGSAPMFELTIGRARCFFVPGVPPEYRHLVETAVLPALEAMLGQARPHLAFRLLKTVLVPESHLDAQVAPLVNQHPEVEFGFRTHAPENHLKLLARGATQAEADARLAAAEAACRALLGEAVFGADDETLEGTVAGLLVKRKETLSLAESCTAGLVMGALSRVPGATGWLYGGAVTYADASKSGWLSIPPPLLTAHGAVSIEVAVAMAEGVRAESGADWGLSITGFAGPGGGTEASPVGTVFVSVARKGKQTVTERHRFPPERERVRTFAVGAALDALRRALLHA
jgi:nicotinamide-nucleotide amidase